MAFDEPELHDGVVFGLLPKLFNLINKADLVVDGNKPLIITRCVLICP